jgi:hypothetical protein
MPMHSRPLLALPLAAALSLALAGCNPFAASSATRVLQVKCVNNTGLDNEDRCLKPERLSSEIEIRVNPVTQQVHFSFVNSRGEWYRRDFTLNDCKVTDADNWSCTKTTGERGTRVFMMAKYGMKDARYYHSLTSPDSPSFYSSGISGLTYWAWHFGLIGKGVAMRLWGYHAMT